VFLFVYWRRIAGKTLVLLPLVLLSWGGASKTCSQQQQQQQPTSHGKVRRESVSE
jgi:hypothetical protein